MSRVRFQQIEAIGEQVAVHWSGPGWPDWDELLRPQANIEHLHKLHRFDLVMTYDVETKGSCLPVCVQYNEAEDTRKVSAFVHNNDVSLVVFHHLNDIDRYWWWDDEAIDRVHIPHCADTKIYRDYGLKKDIDVLVCGNMNDYFYPFRYRLKQIAERVLRRRSWNVVVLPHPGYTLPARENTVTGVEFAKLLNRSKIVFTCSMRYYYALAKYSEIACCRSIPAGDVPDERQEWFRASILELSPSWHDEQIIGLVENVLTDEKLLRHYTETAYGAAMKTSTMAHYAERFLTIAEAHCLRGKRATA